MLGVTLVTFLYRRSAPGRIAPAFLPIVQQLDSNSVQYFGKPLSKVEPTQEIVGRLSRVLRLRIEAGDRVVSIFVKRYEPRTGSPEEAVRFRRYVVNESTRTLLAARGATESAGVVRIIACFPEHFALVTEAAEGVGLDRLFRRLAIVRTASARQRVHRALARVAAWLRIFQASVPSGKTRTRDYRRYVDVRLSELAGADHVRFGAIHRTALEFFDACHPLLATADLAPVAVHGDLCPSNILVRDNAVTVLDLGMSGAGTRYEDLAHVYFHLELAGRRMLFGDALVDSLQRTLLEEFEPCLDAQAPLFRLMLLQQATCYLSQIARRENTNTDTLMEWQRRRRIAWCIDLIGRCAGDHRRLTGTPVRSSGAASHDEVLGEQRAERCVPRTVE